MGEYIVSARKYRPSAFDAVVGQEALTTTLKNAIAAGKLAHAYLFCGPRGVGKTTCARIFAKTINCLHPSDNGEACDECESCKAFNEQRSLNIHELDAASNNSVEEIRALIEKVRIPPQVGRYKVFIIDEVHMLSTAAFNAFQDAGRAAFVCHFYPSHYGKAQNPAYHIEPLPSVRFQPNERTDHCQPPEVRGRQRGICIRAGGTEHHCPKGRRRHA